MYPFFFNIKYNNTTMEKKDQTYPFLFGEEALTELGNTTYRDDSMRQVLTHPTMKKTFIQLGKKFKLPDDIIDYLYLILRKKIHTEEESIKRFHRNILLLNVMIADPKRSTELYDCMEDDYEKTEPFDYRIPEERNCEWAITNSWNKKLTFNENNALENFRDIREKIFVEICILGEENYLFDLSNKGQPNSEFRFKPANHNLKLSYLKHSSFEEVYFDYQNFLEWKGTPEESAWRLIIDHSGDAAFYTGN